MTENKQEMLCMEPLGYIHSPYTSRGEAPPQSVRPEALPGTIEIKPEYVPALKGLEDYSHIIVLFCFDRITGPVELVHKPHGRQELRGLFSTRTPRRPNRIGLSILPLEKIEGNILYVSQVDMLEGTPVLDIKAYEPGLVPPSETVRTPLRESKKSPGGRK